MPYTRTTWADYPNTTTPITATALNNIEQGIVTLDRYNGVYTNEAARDAAITSPAEGMTAYLTAPTVPAATGATTVVPTGVQTIYNGSAWVCVTPVAALSNTSATTSSASYVTTLTSDSTAISVTLSTGTTALLVLSCNASGSAAVGLRTTYSISGATTVAASDVNGALVSVSSAGNAVQLNRTIAITGLTAGTNTFTLNYLVVGGGGTATFTSRFLTVQGVA